MKKLILALLLISQSALATTVIHTYIPTDVFRVAISEDQYYHRNNLFPQKSYHLDSIIVPNSLFKSADNNENVSMFDAQKIALYGTLKLVSFNSATNAYQFNLEFRQDVVLLKETKRLQPLKKEAHGMVSFDKSSTGSYTLEGNLIKMEPMEAATFHSSGNSDHMLTFSNDNNIHLKIQRNIPITIMLDT